MVNMTVPLERRIPSRARAAGVALAVLLLSGCSGIMSSPDGVVEDFESAVSGGDFAAACELLTPAAVSELERSTGESCESALESLDLPEGGTVVHVEAWGRAAIAELEQDTLFLARTGDSWAVRAAGCTSVPEAPYECTVTGG